MTVEEARDLITQTVAEMKPLSRHPRGVLGAAVGVRLARRGARDLHRAFGFEKLSQFIEAHCPALIVRREEGTVDILIDTVAPNEGAPPSEPQPVKPRDISMRGSTRDRVDSDIWRAVLFGAQHIAYVHRESGRIAPGPLPPGEERDSWVRLDYMSQAEQAGIVETVRAAITDIVSNEDLRMALLAALDKAKGGGSPILDFSNVLGAASRLWPVWNTIRVKAVLDHVARSTGVDLRHHRTATPETKVPPERVSVSSTPPSTYTGPPTSRPPEAMQTRAEKPGVAYRDQTVEGLRRVIKQAIDEMSLREILELRLPVEYMRLFSQPAK